MALIKCPDCGAKVSNRAHSCPKCGFPIDEFMEKQKLLEEKKKNAESLHIKRSKTGYYHLSDITTFTICDKQISFSNNQKNNIIIDSYFDKAILPTEKWLIETLSPTHKYAPMLCDTNEILSCIHWWIDQTMYHPTEMYSHAKHCFLPEINIDSSIKKIRNEVCKLNIYSTLENELYNVYSSYSKQLSLAYDNIQCAQFDLDRVQIDNALISQVWANTLGGLVVGTVGMNAVNAISGSIAKGISNSNRKVNDSVMEYLEIESEATKEFLAVLFRSVRNINKELSNMLKKELIDKCLLASMEKYVPFDKKYFPKNNLFDETVPLDSRRSQFIKLIQDNPADSESYFDGLIFLNFDEKSLTSLKEITTFFGIASQISYFLEKNYNNYFFDGEYGSRYVSLEKKKNEKITPEDEKSIKLLADIDNNYHRLLPFWNANADSDYEKRFNRIESKLLNVDGISFKTLEEKHFYLEEKEKYKAQTNVVLGSVISLNIEKTKRELDILKSFENSKSVGIKEIYLRDVKKFDNIIKIMTSVESQLLQEFISELIISRPFYSLLKEGYDNKCKKIINSVDIFKYGPIYLLYCYDEKTAMAFSPNAILYFNNGITKEFHFEDIIDVTYTDSSMWLYNDLVKSFTLKTSIGDIELKDIQCVYAESTKELFKTYSLKYKSIKCLDSFQDKEYHELISTILFETSFSNEESIVNHSKKIILLAQEMGLLDVDFNIKKEIIDSKEKSIIYPAVAIAIIVSKYGEVPNIKSQLLSYEDYCKNKKCIINLLDMFGLIVRDGLEYKLISEYDGNGETSYVIRFILDKLPTEQYLYMQKYSDDMYLIYNNESLSNIEKYNALKKQLIISEIIDEKNNILPDDSNIKIDLKRFAMPIYAALAIKSKMTSYVNAVTADNLSSAIEKKNIIIDILSKHDMLINDENSYILNQIYKDKFDDIGTYAYYVKWTWEEIRKEVQYYTELSNTKGIKKFMIKRPEHKL